MRSLALVLGLVVLMLSGCASMPGKEKPNVLSGEAPVEDVIAKGDEAMRTGDYHAAAVLYQIAVRQEPSAKTWHRLGVVNHRLENIRQALWCYEKALDHDAEHAPTLERLGLYYTAKADVPTATGYLTRLMEADPTNWKAHNSLGVLADLEKRFSDARDHYMEALKLRPDMPMLWNNLGFSVYLLGDMEEAISYMERALELNPRHEAARMNLALVYVRQNDYERALDTFFEVEDIPTSYTKVGYLAYKVGDYDKAEELLQLAIKESPTYNKPAHTYLAATRNAR